MRKFLNGMEDEMEKIAGIKAQDIYRELEHHQHYVETSHCFIKGFGWKLMELLPREQVTIIILRRDKKKIAQSLLHVGSSPLNRDGRNWIILPTIVKPKIPPPSVIYNARLTYIIFRLLKFPFREYKILKRLGLNTPRTPRFIREYEMQCLEWYVDESNAMTEVFRKKFNDARYIDLDVEDLNDVDKVMDLFSKLDMVPDPSVTNFIGTATNRWTQRANH